MPIPFECVLNNTGTKVLVEITLMIPIKTGVGGVVIFLTSHSDNAQLAKCCTVLGRYREHVLLHVQLLQLLLQLGVLPAAQGHVLRGRAALLPQGAARVRHHDRALHQELDLPRGAEC